MKGYPKSLNSWDDVLYVVSNFPKEDWQEDVAKLIEADNVKIWEWDHVLEDAEDAIEDATHKVVEMDNHESNEDGTPKPAQKVQYVLKPNMTCRLALFKFCKTEDDLNKAVAEVEALLASDLSGTSAKTTTGTTTGKTKKASK